MKNHRLLSFSLLFSLLFTLTTTCFAAEQSSSTIHLEPYNEYSYIQTLQECSPKELEEIGITKQEAESIVLKFENALLERALLPDSELQAYGYNNSEIALFRAYANGQPLSSSELYSLGSTCNGDLIRNHCSPKGASFTYKFTWDRCPIMMLSDSAALRWIAYDENSNDIGVEQSSWSMLVEYHYKGNAASDGSPALAFTRLGSNQPNLDFNTLNMQFPVYQTHSSDNGIISDCYAKTGTVTVTVKLSSGSKEDIHHIYIAGLYGHTLVGVGSPSVSVSPGSVGISFTGNTSTDAIASRKGTINCTSSKVEYW